MPRLIPMPKNNPTCPICGAHQVDVRDGKFAPHGGAHTPNKVPFPCPMTGEMIRMPEVRWEVWTQQASGRWTPDWNEDYDDEIQARQAFIRWPDKRARRLVRVERAVVEESTP